MKELDELRDYINRNGAFIHSKGVYYMNKYIDYAEQAIAERYIELPVDADGEPWHIGDAVDGHGIVQSMGLNRHGWHFVGVENAINPALHRHVKPDTIEDVLADFAARAEHLPRSREELLVEIRAILDEWVKERKCHMEYNAAASDIELYPTEAFICSLCGWETLEGKPTYCPRCGAKVVN